MWLPAIAGQQTTSQVKISLWLALLCVKSMREPRRLCVKLPLRDCGFAVNQPVNLLLLTGVSAATCLATSLLATALSGCRASDQLQVSSPPSAVLVDTSVDTSRLDTGI